MRAAPMRTGWQVVPTSAIADAEPSNRPGDDELEIWVAERYVNPMSSLASEDIALRAALLWVFGIFAVAVISGYSIRTYKGRPASWWLFIPTMIGMGCLMLGPVGVVLLLGGQRTI